MNISFACRFTLSFICCATMISSLACSANTASAAKPAPKPSASTQPAKAKTQSLAQYYGFKDMEILKLKWGLSVPIVIDINGDGLNDLITVNNAKARIELLLQKKDFDPSKKVPVKIEDGDVNDIFGKEQAWRFYRVGYDLDVAATALIVADLNNDKLPDLVFKSKEGLYVTLQQPRKPAKKAKVDKKQKSANPSEPKWHPPKRIDLSEGLGFPGALAAGDLNHNGRTDLALLTNDGTFVMLQTSKGTLAQPRKHHSSGENFRKLLIADINADKRDDLVILTADRKFPLRARFQTTAGKLGPEVRLKLTNPGVLELARLGKRNCFLTVSAHSGRVQIWALAPQASKETYPVFTYPLPATGSADKRDIVSADVDGDGLKDVIVTDPSGAEFLLYLAKGESSLASPKRFPGLTDMQKLCTGDLNGKGCHSIVALSIKEKIIAVTSLQKGRLVFPKSVRIKGEPLAMDLADLNGDGKLDLAYIAREKKEDKYYLRTIMALGRKSPAATTRPVTIMPTSRKADYELELTKLQDKPLDMRIGDIDNDGRPDVMIIPSYGPLLLVRQPRAGKFEQVAGSDIHAGLVANIFPSTLSLAPLGPKGTPAILVARKKFARALVFETRKGWQVVDQYQAPSPQSSLVSAIAVKLPGEKDMTIVTYDTVRERLGILSRQKDGTYRTTRDMEVGSLSIRKILAGNFGGRSSLSLLLCGANKLIRILLAGKTYQLRKLASFEPDIKHGRYGALTVGDINSDKCPDIVLCEQNRKHVEILTFNSKAKLVSATKFKVFDQYREVERSRFSSDRQSGTQPRAAVLGDVTGDGKTDLILLIHDRIMIYPQD